MQVVLTKILHISWRGYDKGFYVKLEDINDNIFSNNSQIVRITEMLKMFSYRLYNLNPIIKNCSLFY